MHLLKLLRVLPNIYKYILYISIYKACTLNNNPLKAS